MNLTTKTLIAAIAFAAAGIALADDITPDHYRDTATFKDHAQVVAEREQAKRDGTINAWSFRYNPAATYKSVKTRAEVVAELQAARADGEYAAMNSEDGGASFALEHRAVRRAGQVAAR